MGATAYWEEFIHTWLIGEQTCQTPGCIVSQAVFCLLPYVSMWDAIAQPAGVQTSLGISGDPGDGLE